MSHMDSLIAKAAKIQAIIDKYKSMLDRCYDLMYATNNSFTYKHEIDLSKFIVLDDYTRESPFIPSFMLFGDDKITKEDAMHIVEEYRGRQLRLEKIDIALRIMDLKAPVTKEQVKSAYRAKAKEYHPDVCKDGAERMKVVNEMYSYLMEGLRD